MSKGTKMNGTNIGTLSAAAVDLRVAIAALEGDDADVVHDEIVTALLGVAARVEAVRDELERLRTVERGPADVAPLGGA